MAQKLRLPAGFLGLQLEASSGDTGLRLKSDWNGAGAHLMAGDTILSVDGAAVTSRSFKEAVSLLRVSTQRLIEVQGNGVENHDPNSSLRSPARRNVPVIRSPLTPRRDIVNGPNVMGASSGGKAAKAARPSSSSSEDVAVVANLMEQVEKAKLLYDESLRIVQAKEELVGELTKEVIDLKSQTRGLDGQICLLKFQLVKQKRSKTTAISSVTNAASATSSTLPSASMHDWIDHWRRLQVNLTAIRNRSAYNVPVSATLSDDEPLKPVVKAEEEEEEEEKKENPAATDPQLELIQSLTKRFTVEDRFAQRLQLPSGCNSAVKRDVLSTIETPLMKEKRTSFQPAAAPITSPRMLKEIFDCAVATDPADKSAQKPESSPLAMRGPSTPTCQHAARSVPYGSADIRSAWKAWGAKRFTEVASSYSVNPLRVVFSPASVSPVTFREQMGKLRSENILIRKELSRFREGISRMQEEHREQTGRII